MAYADLTNVENIAAYYHVAYSPNTKPTLVQIQTWIKEATSKIYAGLVSCYDIPSGGIQNANDIILLRDLCNLYVRENIEFVNSLLKINYSDETANRPKSINHSQFYKELEKFRDGTLLLETARSTSYLKFSDYNSANDIEPVAKKESTQW